jgi:tetratricopeptide (TPR) repeat protein
MTSEDRQPQARGAYRNAGLRPGVALGICLAAIVLAYANSLSSEFVYDDQYAVVENHDIRGLANIDRFFTGHYWAGSGSPAGVNYRPIALLTLAVDHASWGLDPLGFRLTNLLLHLAAAVLAYCAARRLTGSVAAALVATAVFGLHPVQTEVVNSAANRGDTLAACFMLAALLCYMGLRHTPRHDGPIRITALIGAWGCFALACLAKETGIAALAVFLAYDLFYGSGGRVRLLANRLRRDLLVAYVGFALIAVAYLYVRTEVLGSLLDRHIGFVENPLAYVEPYQQKILAIAIAGWQARLLLWPGRLSADYSYHALPIDLHWTSADVCSGVIAIVVAAGLLVWAWRRNRVVAFAVCFFAATYSVTSNFFFPNDVMMADRFLSIPLFGVALIGGELFRTARAGLGRRGGVIAVAIAVAAVSAYTGRVVVRNLDWRDELRLMEAADRAAPGSAKTQAALGQVYSEAGRFERSAEAYQKALAIWPQYMPVLSDLALVLSELDRDDEAIRAARSAVKRLARDPLSWNNLGVVYYHAGRLEEAARAWETALSIRPDFAAPRNNLREIGDELKAISDD